MKQALDLYREILAAAIVAPTTDQANADTAALAWAKNQAASCSARAWEYWQSVETEHGANYTRDSAYSETLGELYEIHTRDLARKHVTFTHAAGRVKMLNTRERLQGFAADMVKGAAWALWGGGEKPAELAKPRKIRAASWRAGLVKVAAETLQDRQAADFLAIAIDQLGGRAYMHTAGKPFVAYAPDHAEGLPDGFAVARRCDGDWITMHMESGFSVGLSRRVKSHALESGISAIAQVAPEKFAAVVGRVAGVAHDHGAALQAWRDAWGIAAPEVAPVAQDAPEVAPVAQDAPEVAPVAQDAPEVAGMLPRAWIASAAVDLERITNTWAFDPTRRLYIEAGRLGMPRALPYIRETLQRIATNGHGLEKSEALKSLESLARAQADDVAALKTGAQQVHKPGQIEAEETQTAATVAAVLAIAQASATSAQEIDTSAPALATCETGADVVAMADSADRGQIQRTGDSFADYWANSASASIMADYAAGRVRVVNLGAGPDTPHVSATGAGGDDTPPTPGAGDYSHPVETQAQAPDYSHPVETQASAIPAPTAAAFLRDIPETLARGAFNGTSFSPERRGDRAREGYAGAMAEDWAFFEQHATKGGTLDKLAAEFDRYRARLAGLYRAYLSSESRCVSSFIAGPAKFPVARMNKRADIAHRRLGEYFDTRETARRAVVRNLRPDLRPIMAGDVDAADRLAAELAKAERWQDMMKQANAAIRKHAKAGPAHQVAALLELGFTEEQAARRVTPPPNLACYGQGFPSFKLTNNGANIRRMRQRLEQIERNKAADVTEATGADGVRMEDDPPANRVRLFFPGKPAAEVRDALKAAGFRWAPSLGAWQGYRNHWTLQKARELASITAAELKPTADTPDAYTEAGVADTPSAEAAADCTEAGETPGPADDCTEAGETPGPADDCTEAGETPGPADDCTEAGETQGPADDCTEAGETQGPADDCTEAGETQGPADDCTEAGETQGPADDCTEAGETQGHALAIGGRYQVATFPYGCDVQWHDVTLTEYKPATITTRELFTFTGGGFGYPVCADELAHRVRAVPPTHKQITPDPENAPDRAAWFAVATASETAAKYHQDALDHINGQRLHDTRRALVALGWSSDGNPAYPLTFRGETLRAQLWHVGAGRNVARITWQTTDGETVADDWTRTPQQLADDLHTSACAFMSDEQSASIAQSMTAEQCERVALKLEAINYHGEALQWRCLGAGSLDLAERVATINREHLRAGQLTWELSARRQAISDELRARLTTPPTDPDPGASAPVDCTEAVETQAQAPDCTKAVETSAPAYFTEADIGHKTTIPGWPANTIEGLFDALSRWALDPLWLHYSEEPPIVPAAWKPPLNGLAWRCHERARYDLGYMRTEYILTAPMYPDHPFCRRYNGNFAGYSFGFQVTTDDPDLIARLDAAIAENIARPDTQEAIQHDRERRAMKTSRSTIQRRTA